MDLLISPGRWAVATASGTANNQSSPNMPQPPRAAVGIRQGWRILADLDRQWREARRCAPLPLARWSAAIGLVIWCATGSASSASGWLSAHYPWLIVTALLVFGPEIASLQVGSLRMDLFQQAVQDVKEDVAVIRRQQVAFQQQQAAQAQSANQTVVLDISKLGHLAENVALAKIDPLPRLAVQTIGGEPNQRNDPPPADMVAELALDESK
jgi:hypothetical protein